jgi:hypothetical protein
MVGQEVVKYHPINLHHVDIPTLLTITTNVADLTTTTTTVVVLCIYLSSPKSD